MKHPSKTIEYVEYVIFDEAVYLFQVFSANDPKLEEAALEAIKKITCALSPQVSQVRALGTCFSYCSIMTKLSEITGYDKKNLMYSLGKKTLSGLTKNKYM